MNTKELAPVLDLKAIDDAGVFSGYGATFGNVDSQGEIVVAGAFAKNLAEHRRKGTRPKMFWQHNSRQPIGKWTDLAEDGKGLFVEGKFNMEVQQAREALAHLKEGDIDGLSIGFREVKAEPDPKTGIRRLIELSLIEISVVSLAANERARVDTVKNSPESWWELDARLKEFDGDPQVAAELKHYIEDFLQIEECPKSLRPLFAKRLLDAGRSESDRILPIRSESEGAKAIDAAVAELRASLSGLLPHS